ncbi:phage major tail tube protein [Ottowia sp.]|uniref:phage major tail tube protein n=1 Tax=Ottowia sp. TaxID=1898956 RepID=UPI003A856FAC
MGLPRKLKAMAVFVNGTHYAGECTEATPPTMERETEDYRAGGMDGPVKLDMGGKELTLTLKMAGHVAALITQYGGSLSGTQLRLVQAVQADDTDAVQGVEVVARGRLIKFDPGNAKVGDLTEHEYEFALTYFKWIDNGTTLVEVDYINMIENVGGVDRMQQTKATLGI